MQDRRSAFVLTLLLLLASNSNAQLFPGSSNSALGSNDRPSPLPMDKAFPYFVSIVDAQTFTINWQIAADHYLYRHRFDFSLQVPSSSEAETLAFELPAGIARTDQFFGDVEVYFDGVTATLSTPSDLPAGTKLIIQFQGCATWGFCYPPQAIEHSLATN